MPKSLSEAICSTTSTTRERSQSSTDSFKRELGLQPKTVISPTLALKPKDQGPIGVKGILKKPKELAKTASVKSNDLENQGDDEGSRSNIISLPSNVTDDFIGFSDVPINKVSFENEGKILGASD